MQSRSGCAIVTRMTAKLTISLSDEVLEALQRNQTLIINLETSGGGRSGNGRRARKGPGRPKGRPRGRPPGGEEPRAGSLPARVIEWAEKRGKSFGTNDITKKFKLSRAHASMLLSRLANGSFPIRREARGVYIFGG